MTINYQFGDVDAHGAMIRALAGLLEAEHQAIISDVLTASDFWGGAGSAACQGFITQLGRNFQVIYDRSRLQGGTPSTHRASFGSKVAQLLFKPLTRPTSTAAVEPTCSEQAGPATRPAPQPYSSRVVPDRRTQPGRAGIRRRQPSPVNRGGRSRLQGGTPSTHRASFGSKVAQLLFKPLTRPTSCRRRCWWHASGRY